MTVSPSWNNKYWYAYSDHLTEKFGERVYKATISAGFTCPTRDGTRGTKGCAFCDERGSASFFSNGQASLKIREQIDVQLSGLKARFGARKFLAYFQSFTNTYGPVSYLQEVYDGAINHPEIVGLAIGTRPDCVPGDVLGLLNSYGRHRYVSLELGLQSFRDDTLAFYQRGHSVAEGLDAIARARKFPNLNLSVHLMFGAPGETVQDAIEAAKIVNGLGVDGVKIHQLMILKDTILAKVYRENPWPLFSMEEYNELVIAFLERLRPNIYVERTHAISTHPEELVAPTWASQRFAPMNGLRNALHARGTYQGYRLEPIPAPAQSKFSEL